MPTQILLYRSRQISPLINDFSVISYSTINFVSNVFVCRSVQMQEVHRTLTFCFVVVLYCVHRRNTPAFTATMSFILKNCIIMFMFMTLTMLLISPRMFQSVYLDNYEQYPQPKYQHETKGEERTIN